MATSSHSSHPTFSYTDNIAATWTDFFLLVGRVFLGWLFLASGYDTAPRHSRDHRLLHQPRHVTAEHWAWFAAFAEVILGVP